MILSDFIQKIKPNFVVDGQKVDALDLHRMCLRLHFGLDEGNSDPDFAFYLMMSTMYVHEDTMNHDLWKRLSGTLSDRWVLVSPDVLDEIGEPLPDDLHDLDQDLLVDWARNFYSAIPEILGTSGNATSYSLVEISLLSRLTKTHVLPVMSEKSKGMIEDDIGCAEGSIERTLTRLLGLLKSFHGAEEAKELIDSTWDELVEDDARSAPQPRSKKRKHSTKE